METSGEKENFHLHTTSEKKYFDKLGVFEGGGYTAKGAYRPCYDSMMNTFKEDEFCTACQEAIQKMTDFYSA